MTGQAYIQATEETTTMEYDLQEAKVLAMIICQFSERLDKESIQFAQQLFIT